MKGGVMMGWVPKIINNAFSQFLIDRISHHLITMDTIHNASHEGRLFGAVSIGIDDIISTNSSKWFLLKPEKEVHILARTIEMDQSRIKVTPYEGVTVENENSLGDKLDVVCYNRVKKDDYDPGLEITILSEAPDIEEASGLLPHTIKAETGVGQRIIPFIEIENVEWVLDTNKLYALEVENIGNDTVNILEINWVWYVVD